MYYHLSAVKGIFPTRYLPGTPSRTFVNRFPPGSFTSVRAVSPQTGVRNEVQEEQGESISENSPPTVQPKVELLNAGTEPRQELRFKPMVNAQQTATMTMNMDMSSSIAGQPLPSVKLPATAMTMKTVVTKVDNKGDIHYQFSYSNVDVMGNTTFPPQVLNAMRSQIKKMVGMSGSAIVDNLGQTKEASFVLPEGLDQNTKQMLEQTFNSLEQLYSPLPEQAVGIGAKWRVSSSPSTGGMKLTNVTTYELVSLKDNVATLNVSVEQHAAPQNLTQPGLPTKVTITLKSYDSQGQGQVMMPLDFVMPTRSTVSMRSNSEMNLREAGKVEETTMDTNLFTEFTLESK